LSILPIYLYGSDALRRKAKLVSELTNERIELIHDMFETMHKANGIGLAGNQVGVLERIIVLDISDVEGNEAVPPMVLINPAVKESSGERELEEGCLSIPGVRDQVRRAEKVTVEFRDGGFNEVKLETDGLLARVILHEIDHLNGVFFTDLLSPARRRLHKSALEKIRAGEVEVNYPVVLPETVAK
jgi:peptide deformylase